MENICIITNCGPSKQRLKMGLCNKHYKRHKKGQRIEEMEADTGRNAPLAVRYRSYVDMSSGLDGCWPWTGCTRLSNTTEYGRITYNKKTYSAHRIGFELANGFELTTLSPTIPVHHTCGNSLCQQPKHLQATTKAENTAEMLERHSYLKRIAYLEGLLESNGILYKK